MTRMEARAPWPGWEITDYLGGGSFGAVYRIQREISGVTEYAAMKMIPVPREPEEGRDLLNSGYDLQSINRRYKADLEEIRREYSMMALLKGNANVVYCDDICDEPNPDGIGWKLYIRMELLTPLTRALADPCSEAQVVKVGMDLCNALAACRRKNIIHRDIKPANIMVAEDGNYKLGDFGVAKTMEGTSGGTKTGTYNFMAPEVYNNRPYGPAVDIYSLGMVLYWMLNRRCAPFLPLPPVVPTASQMEYAKERRFSGEQLPPPANGSPALKQIVLRACAFDPAQRYSAPEELYADLADLSRTLDQERTYGSYSAAATPSGGTVDDRSNAWDNEYDKTQGSVYSGGGTRGGTVGGTAGGTVGGDGSHIGPFDVRGQLRLTAQEMASGCVRQYTTPTGKKINVTVNPGTAAGTVMRLTGAGREDPATGARGNAYLTVVLEQGNSGDFWQQESRKAESRSVDAGVIPTALARSGGSRTFKFSSGKTKTVQIPAGCQNGQVVDGVKVYVHDFNKNEKNLRDLPDAVLEMYASQSSGLVKGVLFAFLLWMIIGMTTMLIPVMAVGLMVHIVIAFISGIKKQQVINEAANILKTRQKR